MGAVGRALISTGRKNDDDWMIEQGRRALEASLPLPPTASRPRSPGHVSDHKGDKGPIVHPVGLDGTKDNQTKSSEPFWPKGFFPRIWLAIQLIGIILANLAAAVIMGWVVWTTLTSDVSTSDDCEDCFIDPRHC
jgi:hypothetical protein